MDLERRIKMAKRKSDDRNCLGTALFISGVCNNDGHYYPTLVYDDVLRYLVTLKKAEVGAIVVLERISRATGSIEAMHAGVVTSLNPARVVHRDGMHGKLILDEDLSRFRRILDYDRLIYHEYKWSLRYYSSIPRELKPFL